MAPAADERDCNVAFGPIIEDRALLWRLFASAPGASRHERLQLPQRRKEAFTVDGVLSGEECSALIEAAERKGFGPAGIGGEHQIVNKFRRSSYRLISDDVGLAQLLWSRVREHVPVVQGGRRVLGLNERLRFLRYTAGQHFGPHYDGIFERKGTENRSYLTVQFYLNDCGEMSGGATRFHGGTTADGVHYPDVDCTPRRGRALVFEHDILHEGTRVSQGVKYAVRTDVEYGPPSVAAMVQALLGFGGSPAESRRHTVRLLAGATLMAALTAAQALAL